MSKQTLKDSHHNVMGYIEDRGDRLVGMDKHLNIVGYYDKNLDRTTDDHLNIVGTGNLLSGLIFKA